MEKRLYSDLEGRILKVLEAEREGVPHDLLAARLSSQKLQFETEELLNTINQLCQKGRIVLLTSPSGAPVYQF